MNIIPMMHSSGDVTSSFLSIFEPVQPPSLSSHGHNGIVTDSWNTKWKALAVPLLV